MTQLRELTAVTDVVQRLQRRKSIESLSDYLRLADPSEAILHLDRDRFDRVFDEPTAKVESIINSSRHR